MGIAEEVRSQYKALVLAIDESMRKIYYEWTLVADKVYNICFCILRASFYFFVSEFEFLL